MLLAEARISVRSVKDKWFVSLTLLSKEGRPDLHQVGVVCRRLCSREPTVGLARMQRGRHTPPALRL